MLILFHILWNETWKTLGGAHLTGADSPHEATGLYGFTFIFQKWASSSVRMGVRVPRLWCGRSELYASTSLSTALESSMKLNSFISNSRSSPFYSCARLVRCAAGRPSMSYFFISLLIFCKSVLLYLRSNFIRFITQRSWLRLNAVFDKPLFRYCRNNDNLSSSVYVFILFIEENWQLI